MKSTFLEGYIRRNRITGPRAAEALKHIKEDHGSQVAKETGEKFIRWAISHGHHYNLRDIKAFVAEASKELKQERELPSQPSL